MKYEKRLLLRILVLILITLLFNLFYTIFYWPTISISYFILKFFIPILEVNYFNHYLKFGFTQLNFINACVAGSAYYLWSLLVLFTKDLGKRVWKLWSYGILLILSMNILRIIILIGYLYNLTKGKNENPYSR